MRNKTTKQSMNLILAGLIILMTGCFPQPNRVKSGAPNLVNVPSHRSTGLSSSSHVQNSEPYTGAVKLSIDTGIISDELKSWGFKKTKPRKIMQFKKPTSFKIQAVPNGPVVFQETFNKSQGTLEQIREFTVTDTSKRYTLHIDSQGIPSMRVNVNGFDWILPKDFKGRKRKEITKDKLLLNPTNSIRVTLNGGNNGQVTVTIVEGGSAGIIRRNNGPLNEHRTQHEHTKKNDTNIFDPDDPASLANLERFEQIPENEDNRSLPTFSLNDGQPVSLSASELQVKIKEPVQTNLDSLLSKYNAVVSNEVSDSEFLIQFDLEKVNLKEINNNIVLLNSMVSAEAALKEVTIDSGDGAKMLGLLVELLIDFKQGSIVAGIDMNPVMFSGVSSSREGTGPNNQSYNAEDSWWLKKTGVLEAWDKTMGFDRVNNRPVHVAVVDAFDSLDLAIQEGEDFQGQVFTDKAARVLFSNINILNQVSGEYEIKVNPATDGTLPDGFIDILGKNAHGLGQISTIASLFNNGETIAGVAPHAKIIPIQVGLNQGATRIVLAWDLRFAIQAASQLGADVVSITSSTIVNDVANWLNNVQSAATDPNFGWLAALQKAVDDAARNTGTICLFNAGNIGNHARNTLPAGKLENIAIVGAIMINENDPNSFERAMFKKDRLIGAKAETEKLLFLLPGSLDGFEETASVWWTGPSGPFPLSILNGSRNPDVADEIRDWETGIGNTNLKLFAPGDSMGALGVDLNNLRSLITRDGWGGTSAATPFSAGALALLKSLKPDLTVQDILSGGWVKFRNIQQQDFLLKDYYAFSDGTRKGDRLSATLMSYPVIDVKETILNAAQGNTNNNLKEFSGTLKKENSFDDFDNNRPYLETDNGQIDLSMAFPTLSSEVRQDSHRAFWLRLAKDVNGNEVRTEDLIDKPVKVKGWRYTATNESNHPDNVEVLSIEERDPFTPPPPNPSKTWTLEMFNVNDLVEVSINGSAPITATYNETLPNPQDPNRRKIVNITDKLNDNSPNTIQVKVTNTTNSTPGFAMGVEIKADNEIVFRDIRGNIYPRAHTNVFGANRGDDSLGPMYLNTIVVNKDLSLPGSQPYSAGVFNTSDVSQVRVNVANIPVTMQADGQYSGQAVIDPFLNLNNINQINFEVFSSLVTFPYPLTTSHQNSKSYTWGFELKNGAGQRIYYNRDGQRENLDITQNASGQTIGSGALFNKPHNVLGEQVLDDLFRPFVP